MRSTATSTSVTRSIVPFLVDLDVAAEARHLQLAGFDDRFDGGGERDAGRTALRPGPGW